VIPQLEPLACDFNEYERADELEAALRQEITRLIPGDRADPEFWEYVRRTWTPASCSSCRSSWTATSSSASQPRRPHSAHLKDLKVQGRYGVRFLTYWFDEERQTAFCLAKAPRADAVEEVHRASHGYMAYQIIEVNEPMTSRSPNGTTSSAPRCSLPRGCVREPTPAASSSRAPCMTLRWARASPSAAAAGCGSKGSTRQCPPSRSCGGGVDRDPHRPTLRRIRN
jgi:hypothetical protein